MGRKPHRGAAELEINDMEEPRVVCFGSNLVYHNFCFDYSGGKHSHIELHM